MALAPLFVDSLEELARLLRLSKLPAGKSGTDLFEHAVSEARMSLWQALGQAKIDEISLTAYTQAPSTVDEYRRMGAHQVEVDLVRYHLADSMPLVVRDGTPEFVPTHNTENGFKFLSASKAAELRSQWWVEINRMLAVVSGETKVAPTDAGASVGITAAGQTPLILNPNGSYYS